jgi:hypothetical protein
MIDRHARALPRFCTSEHPTRAEAAPDTRAEPRAVEIASCEWLVGSQNAESHLKPAGDIAAMPLVRSPRQVAGSKGAKVKGAL